MNKELLKGIPVEKRELAKLLLFSIEERILLWRHLDQSQNYLKMKDTLMDEANEVLQILIKRKVIELSYVDHIVRYSLALPFYTENEPVDDTFVEKFRNLWDRKYTKLAGKKSDKVTVRKLLNFWMSENPSITQDRIIEAAKRYLKNCLVEGRFIRDCANFIGELNNEGIINSQLSAWVEEVEVKVQEKGFDA